MTITPAGLVGLGTASPDSKLNIVGTGNDGNPNGDYNGYFYFANN